MTDVYIQLCIHYFLMSLHAINISDVTLLLYANTFKIVMNLVVCRRNQRSVEILIDIFDWMYVT